MAVLAFYSLLLTAPIAVLLAHNGAVLDALGAGLSSAGLVAGLYAAGALVKVGSSRLAAALVTVLLLTAFLVRTLLAFVYDFSGKGFDAEFFLHLNATSLAVGWHAYRGGIAAVAVITLAAAALAFGLVRRQRSPSRRISLSLLPLSALLVYAGASSAPEVDLARAWLRYTAALDPPADAPVFELRRRAAQELAPIRRSSSVPVVKTRIEAALPAEPLNLVLVYLESFNLMLTDDQRYPGLTPRINELKSRYLSFGRIRSSAYLTVEGIANSQCGTLFGMKHANNSLITSTGRLPALPCLGDILRTAGYRQVYLGGAPPDFAGKGAFLREHGYDEVIGWKYFERRGFEAVGNWGVADDALFDEALARIRTLRRGGGPFNLTLLTLGTHLPGFVYDDCPRYSEKDEHHFLNAVHCTDHLLGEFVGSLESEGVLDDTVLLVQADHGVFKNPGMRALFGDDVHDTRLVTLIAAPRLPVPAALATAVRRAGSSVDTVASVLDVLGVEHNVDFVLAESWFDAGEDPRYVVTRRADYLDGEVVANNPAACGQAVGGEPIAPPLDDCEKSRTMRAIASLNATYASLTPQPADNPVCRLQARAEVDPDTGRVRVNWGAENLTGHFHHRGRRVGEDPGPGIHVVLLDEADDVRGAMFFQVDNEYDLWRAKSLIDGADGEGALLIVSSAGRAGVDPSLRRLWPQNLADHRIVYGAFAEGRFEKRVVAGEGESRVRFTPASCTDPERR